MNERYYSLDIFRGATVALMILVNNPGSWSAIYSPFEHATWHGCTPTDLVFPFFLFAIGNAMAFVMKRAKEKGNYFFIKKVLKRSLLIFAIGLFLNWCPFFVWKNDHLVFKQWENIRILGVLQRIALCYLFASTIVFFSTKGKTIIIISVSILLVYWLLCFSFGNTADPYSLSGYFGIAVDKTVLGSTHLYKGEGVIFDPEGLASTLPAVVNVIIGYLAGKCIIEKGKTWEMLSNLFIFGSFLIFIAFAWDMSFPVNKKIWTSSYVLYSSGLALMVLGIFIYLLEFKEAKGAWSKFFSVFGKNPLFIFFLSGFLPRILALLRWKESSQEYTSPLPWFYEHFCKPLFNNLKNGSIFYAVCMIIFYWTIVYWLDKRKIYIKV